MTMPEGMAKRNLRVKELEKEVSQYTVENTELRCKLASYEVKTCVSEVYDGTDYEDEYRKLKVKFDNSVKTIKYISSLL